MFYGYAEIEKDIKQMGLCGFEVGSLGKSVFGREILYVVKGDGRPNAMIFGAIHAREHVTAKLVSDMAKNHVGRAILFVPLANPDGVELCINGIESAPESYRKFLSKITLDGKFDLWKANGRAVDLNVNFDAGWGRGRQNRFKPSAESYVGPYAESEPETKALISATKRFGIKKALCYHAKGEVIYYGYDNGETDRKAAEALSEITGYVPQQSIGSHGGFKDWFTKIGGHALTVEVGADDKSYTELYGCYNGIYERNSLVPTTFTEEIWT